MRHLDVCINPDAAGSPDHPVPYLLVVQGDHVEVATSRVVIPLARLHPGSPVARELTPVVEVAGERLVVMSPLIAGIPVRDIGPAVASLTERHSEIRRAIDVLTGDF
ncbi:CcdB family protein [Azospirillum thermophilum]|uniref:Toxin CcdB n=1 Tax=Azospirillum thermophilum TaxID=2202148 RepID=A0A2S2CW63_9PROT|nr:CcdB family protein [Azospirillum thermophilum]AWK88721.1 plasmid maintenance protein CcdB [Azospirillum thermophilum]